MAARDRDAALSSGELSFLISEWVSDKFNLPESDIPNMSVDYTPESAAASLRQYWGMGNSPINNIIKLLESKGIRVFSLNENVKTIDAFSCWKSNIPFIFLNNFKTCERSRFDAAHELGHLVLHCGGRSHSRQAEKEADTFASCFLMPEPDVRSIIAGSVSFERLFKAKIRWKVSLSALCYRLHKLEILSDWQYRTFCIEISKRFGKTEPNSVPLEGSALWKMVLSELWKDKITKKDIADQLYIPLLELENLINFERPNSSFNHDRIKGKGLSLVG